MPASDWCASLLKAYAEHPDAPAIGGPVAPAPGGSVRDLGVYFCEYGQYAPPARRGPVHDLSGANLSYRRSVLFEAGDLLDAGKWETLLHLRWRAEGRTLFMSDATVIFQNAMSTSTIFRQRLAYGRGYAANRLPPGHWLLRLGYAAFCPVLPVLLTLRLASTLGGKGRWRDFVCALPWVVLLNGFWAAGEFTGYVRGDSGKVENY